MVRHLRFSSRSRTDSRPSEVRGLLGGEQVSYIRGEQDWLAVYGVKDNRIFFRKVVLACAGKSWHHIAFEYPDELKSRMAQFVSRATFAIDQAENDGCDEGSGVASLPAPRAESRGRDRRGAYDQQNDAPWRFSKEDSANAGKNNAPTASAVKSSATTKRNTVMAGVK